MYIIGVSQRIFHKKLRSTFLGVAKCGKCQAFSLQSLRVLSTHVGMASDRNESYFKTTLLSQKKGDPGPRILDSQPTWCLQKLPKPATEKQRYHPITTKDAYESKPVENPWRLAHHFDMFDLLKVIAVSMTCGWQGSSGCGSKQPLSRKLCVVPCSVQKETFLRIIL